MKYLGINLTKQVQDLYAENYKTLMKELKTLVIWETDRVHRLEYSINILRCQFSPSWFIG